TPSPFAGEQVRFPKGSWAALPQVGPDGKVRRCVLVAPRQRMGKDGPINTRFALNIDRGAVLVVSIGDDSIRTESVLDDQPEILVGGTSFPAVGSPIGNSFVSPAMLRPRCLRLPRPRRSASRMAPVSIPAQSPLTCHYCKSAELAEAVQPDLR